MISDHGLCLRLVCPVLHIPPGATVASRPTCCPVSGLISDGMVEALYLFREIEPMHLIVEGLRR